MQKEVAAPRAPPARRGSRGSVPAKVVWHDPHNAEQEKGRAWAVPTGCWLYPTSPVLLGSGCLGGLFTGKVVLQGGEEVSDDRHTPGPPKQLLAGTTAHVGHIRVVYRKAEDPGGWVGGGHNKKTGSQKRPFQHAYCLRESLT